MNVSKKSLFVGLLVTLGCTLIIFLGVSVFSPRQNQLVASYANSSATPAGGTFSPSPQSGSAFVSRGTSNVVLPQSSNIGTVALPLTNNNPAVGTDGAKATSLSDVQNIISSTLSVEEPTTTAVLALPDVPDSEISINPSGASTTFGYLAYFNAHAKDIAFDNKKFENVLKDKNGVMLFLPSLIEKAIADDNFSETANSLSVQKDFAEAEINFLKSIPVTGAAVAVNKQNIGMEELMVGVIDKALAVSSGSMSENDFLNYDDQFDATAETARQNLVAQSGVLSLSKPPSFFDRVLGILGIGTAAKAQVVDTPFGGTIIGTPIFCSCDLGYNIFIGPPVPAVLHVPLPFLLTPLFFSDKTLIPGSWWLGVYDASLQIPCGQLPACEPSGIGGELIMTGSGPPSP